MRYLGLNGLISSNFEFVTLLFPPLDTENSIKLDYSTVQLVIRGLDRPCISGKPQDPFIMIAGALEMGTTIRGERSVKHDFSKTESRLTKREVTSSSLALFLHKLSKQE